MTQTQTTPGRPTPAQSDAHAEALAEYRQQVREFIVARMAPQQASWDRAGEIPRTVWREAGAAGLLVPEAPREFGGRQLPDQRARAIVAEELVRAGVTVPVFVAHNDVATSSVRDRAAEHLKRHWLPALVAGEAIAAIAMTEPGGGSDLSGLQTTWRRIGDEYRLDGEKTFITNAGHADLFVVAARRPDTDKLSLFLVPATASGVERAPKIDTLGRPSTDVAGLTLTDCRIPVDHLLGREDAGGALLMSAMVQERLSIAVVAVASAERTLALAIEHARTRHAFGSSLGGLQHNKFVLATLDTEVTIARVFIDHCLDAQARRRLSVIDAAKAKWWTTELQGRVADAALQLRGGRGYTQGDPAAAEWLDSRVQTIYGGPTEVMKDMIGAALRL